jgi:hypothetical protein
VFWVASAQAAPATAGMGAGPPCPATERGARTAAAGRVAGSTALPAQARDLGRRYTGRCGPIVGIRANRLESWRLTVMGVAGSVYVASSMSSGSSAPATLDADVGDLRRTDDDLAREINAEHGLVETYKHNTIEHAIRCGELHREMKRCVGHDNRLPWVQEHFQASERTARNYMEIAKSAAVGDLSQDTTMRSALRRLRLADPLGFPDGDTGELGRVLVHLVVETTVPVRRSLGPPLAVSTSCPQCLCHR